MSNQEEPRTRGNPDPRASRNSEGELGSHAGARQAPTCPHPQSDTDPPTLLLTRPLLPDIQELLPYLSDILDRGWVTNNGRYVQQLERALADYLNMPTAVAVTNGTIGLDLALRALLPEGGEVVTTAYSFPATYHVLLSRGNIRTVFADIDEFFCIDPDSLADRIGPNTKAILAVHTYGYPCNYRQIEDIARAHNIPVLYDAAHAFGVKIGDRDISSLGDVSVFSFHATKVFNTLEGGCVVPSQARADLLETIRLLRNFGIRDEHELVLYGTNGKMDEVRAVFGLLNLNRVDGAIARRKQVVQQYLSYFSSLNAADLSICHDVYTRPHLRLNYAYFPILIHPSHSFTRDLAYDYFRSRNIMVRKYFYPTITTSPLYRELSPPGNLKKSDYASRNVLCLPVHQDMTPRDVLRVLDEFDAFYRRCHR